MHTVRCILWRGCDLSISELKIHTATQNLKHSESPPAQPPPHPPTQGGWRWWGTGEWAAWCRQASHVVRGGLGSGRGAMKERLSYGFNTTPNRQEKGTGKGLDRKSYPSLKDGQNPSKTPPGNSSPANPFANDYLRSCPPPSARAWGHHLPPR